MSMIQILEYVVYYAPVAIFLLFVIWGLIVGLIRGFRKSLILFIQAIVAAGICVGVFYFLVNNPQTDKWVYDLSSKFVDYNDKLGTTTQYTGMRDVLVDVIIKNADYGNGFKMVMEENGAYLDTLVNLAYRLVLFLALLILFFPLVFIFYLIYFIFYPERRKKAKMRAKERLGEGNGYHKHPFFGGLVGAVRGAVIGLVWLSFIGALFFVVAGGPGEEPADSYPDYTFTDEDINTGYAIYKVVGSYGSKGIFRVLNTIKDSEKVPFYLFAANMVLSGNLNDETAGIHTTVRFTKEIANYTDFVNKTIQLILKYDKNGRIKDSIDSKDSSTLMDLMNDLMENEDFQAEYDALIDSFNAGTYFINFGLSFINSIVSHRNELKFSDNLDEQIIEILDIVFDGDHKITVSSLLTEGDARQLLKSVVSVLSVQTTINDDTPDVRKGLLYGKAFIPELLKLSIFTDEKRAAQFNPLLQDLYDYLATKTINNANLQNLTLAKSSFDSKAVIEEKNATNISWIDELSMLLNNSLDIIEIADTIYQYYPESTENPLDMIFNIFPSDNEAVKNKNLERYEKIIRNISSSKLLDSILSMTVIRDMIDNTLSSLPGNIVLPSKINYVNEYDDKGEIVVEGEIYVLLSALREIILSPDSKEIVSTLTSGSLQPSIIKSIAGLFNNETSDGKSSLIDISLKSSVLKYTISGLLLGLSESDEIGIKIIVPNDLCETDAENISTIKKDELKTLFSSIVGSLDIIGEDNQINFKKIVENVDSLSDSQIIEATVVYLLVDKLKDVELVSIPETYLNAGTLEALKTNFTNNIWHTKDEISNIIFALDEILNISHADDFDITKALDGIADHIGSLNDKSERETDKTKLQVVYKSDVLRSTFKNIVVTKVSDEFIDTRILNSSAIIETIDNIESIKISEIEALIYSFNELELDFQNMNLDSIADKVLGLNGQSVADSNKTKVDVLFDSTLIRYILTKQMDKVLTEDLIQAAIRDSSYVKDDEVIDAITYHYYKKDEIKGLVNSLNELSITDFNNVDSENIKSNVLALDEQSTVDNTKTKLDILYSSSIIKFALVKQVDNALTEDLIPTAVRDSEEVKTIVSIDSNPYAYYKQSEIISIIKSTKELGITNLDGIDADIVKGKVLELNDAATTSTTGTKLDVLYSSTIIKYAIAKQMDGSIGADLTPTAVRDSENVKEFNTISGTQYGYYKKSEISNLIYSTKELGITDLDGIDPDVVKGKVLELNDAATTSTTGTKLDVLYSSTIIKYAIAKQMDGSIDADLTPTAVRDSENVKEFITISEVSYGYYKKSEVSNLIYSTKELGITDLDGIDPAIVKGKVLELNDNATTATTGTKLDVLYSSTIIKYAIAKQMDGSIDADLTPTAVRDSENVKEFITISAVPYGYYKQAEVANLIYSTKELGITSLDGIDPATVKGKVLDLNDDAITDSGTLTKLDVLYTSTIIKYAIAKQMDGSIGADLTPTAVRDSENVKEFITISAVPYGYYKKLEVKNLISSTKELGITSLDGIDTATVKGKVLDLNDDATTDSGTLTKLDVLYTSTIIKYAIAKQMDGSIGADLIPTAVRDSENVKEFITVSEVPYGYYKKLEVKNLIDSTEELGITNLDGIDPATVKGKVLDLNDDATTDSGTLTKLDVLYTSTIIKYAIAEQMNDAIDTELVPNAVRESEHVKEFITVSEVPYGYYKKLEMMHLIDSINELKFANIDAITGDAVKDEVLNLNKSSEIIDASDDSVTKLDVLYRSIIIEYAIANQLDTAITVDLVSLNVRDSDLTKDYLTVGSDKHYYYKQAEVVGIINAVTELNIIDIGDISVSQIKGEVANLNKDATTDSGTLTKLDVLYSSIVIKYAVSDRFEAIFTNATLDVDAKVLAKAKDNDEIATNYYYIKSDVAKLVDALGAKGLGITTLDDTNNVDENTVLGLNNKATGSDETKLHVIYKSPIMAYILTDKLSAAINSNAILVDDVDAKYDYSDTEVKFYLESELESLIKALADLGVTDVNAVDASSITLNATVKDDILDSILLFDAVSKIVIDNNTLVKPTISLTKNSDNTVSKIVDDDQMTYLLNVLIELGVSNMSAGITVNLSSDVNENISLSYILRATVSDKVLDNSEIKVATANIDSVITDYNVIKETEMLAMLNAISEGLGLNNVSGITSNISLPGKSDANLDAKLDYISASQIIRTTITSKIEFKDSSNNTIELYILAQDSDVLNNVTSGTNNLLSIKQAEMKKILKAIIVAFGGTDSTSTGGQVTLATLQGLNASDLDTFMASSSIVLVTDSILNKPAYIGMYTVYTGSAPSVTTENVYNTAYATFTPLSHTYITAESQKDMISKVS